MPGVRGNACAEAMQGFAPHHGSELLPRALALALALACADGESAVLPSFHFPTPSSTRLPSYHIHARAPRAHSPWPSQAPLELLPPLPWLRATTVVWMCWSHTSSYLSLSGRVVTSLHALACWPLRCRRRRCVTAARGLTTTGCGRACRGRPCVKP